MAELVAEVKTLVVHMGCDKCGKGIMVFDHTAPVLLTYPAKYRHECSECGYANHFNRIYPYNRTVEAEPLRKPKDNER